MKRIMLLAALVAVCCSCQKEDVKIENTPEGIPVRVNFAGAGSVYDTRAFFDNVATAEPWEKKIHRLDLYVFNEAGNIAMIKHLTEAEINSLNGMVYLPESANGKEYSIYAVANHNITTIVSKISDILKVADSAVDRYNNFTFQLMSVGNMRAEGFPMTGYATVFVPDDTAATITLKRIVAKVAVQIEVADDFSERYGGSTLWVKSVEISKVQNISYLFPGSGPDPTWQLSGYTYNQESEIKGNTSNNLFYLYEQNPCTPGNESYLRVSVRFDQDGKSTTSNDQVTKTIQVPLQGSGSGEIKRNGYYRIKGTVTDFDALHLHSIFTVEEWETPQTTDLGDISM